MCIYICVSVCLCTVCFREYDSSICLCFLPPLFLFSFLRKGIFFSLKPVVFSPRHLLCSSELKL